MVKLSPNKDFIIKDIYTLIFPQHIFLIYVTLKMNVNFTQICVPTFHILAM